ncbi:MAG: methyltransferase domain-containing protein, partial [Desulfobacterales bacterium]|nr:methyltransferase domain-containing protein [Desulfobacterales bacterium]
LNMLNYFELNVNEIVSIVGMIQSGVSRHLKILMESGLLESRKDGSFIYYSAAHTPAQRPLIELACARVADEPLCRADLQKAEHSIDIRKNRTKRFFRTVAPQWDRLKREVLGDFQLNQVLLDNVEVGLSVADIGCGTGEMLSALNGRDRGALIGVDSSPEMLEQAKIRLFDARDIELRLGEAEYLPLKNKEVDVAVMSMVLYHIVEPEKAIAEVQRVLKPGGRFLLADFECHNKEEIKDIIGGTWMGFEIRQIEEWMEQTGFTLDAFKRYKVEKGLVIHLFSAVKDSES